MDPSHQSLSLNPNSLNHRFAKGFLRALMRIQKHGHTKTISPSKASPREIAKRRCRVKMAADAAMASAVGRSRVWSQAVLRRIRNQKQRHPASFFKRIRDVSGSGATNSVKVIKRGTKEKKREVGFVNVGQEKRLRKVVPGGKGMDICSLLDETAHYIKCLTTQVKVMKRIAEISSTT